VLNGRLTLFVHFWKTMMLDDIPLFSMLKGRLGYLDQQQRLIAENVANSDTPGFTPQDLKPFAEQVKASAGASLALAPVRTTPAHLSGHAGGAGGGAGVSVASSWKAQATPDSETRMDGNQVVLEEEMMKMTQARMNYDTALGFYQKSLALIQLALHAPGKPA
jgi:flagellar basal-body rod protein FlgB